jgi:hypothetical protein
MLPPEELSDTDTRPSFAIIENGRKNEQWLKALAERATCDIYYQITA